MKLDELKKMIKEELDSFIQNENEVSEVDVDVDAEAGDMEDKGGESEDILRQIYDMLKDKFEGEEDMGDMGDEEPAEDVEETYMDENMDEGDEDKMEENSTTDAKFQKQGFAAGGGTQGGTNAGYGAVGGKGSTGYDAGSKALQERFQKLANIIK